MEDWKSEGWWSEGGSIVGGVKRWRVVKNEEGKGTESAE